MKKLLLSLLIVSVGLQAPLVAAGKVDGASNESAIVVVEVGKVFQALDEARAEIERLREEIVAMSQELSERETALNKKAQDLQTKKKAMDAKAQEKADKDLEQEAVAFMQDKQALGAQAAESEQRLQAKYLKKISDFCRKQGWQIVLPMAIYVTPGLDKTDEVIAGLNKEYKRAQEAKKKAKETAKGA